MGLERLFENKVSLENQDLCQVGQPLLEWLPLDYKQGLEGPSLTHVCLPAPRAKGNIPRPHSYCTEAGLKPSHPILRHDLPTQLVPRYTCGSETHSKP